jgi:outer membrane biosynthesis protein TonB
VRIEKLPTKKGEYANYKVGIGKNPAPLDHYMSLLTDAEVNALVRLEDTLHVVTPEEEKEILKRYMGAELYAEMTGAKPEQNEEEEPKPKVQPTPEGTVKPAKEPTPEPTPEPTAEPRQKTQAKEPEPTMPIGDEEEATKEEEKPYTTKEVTNLLGQDKEGVKILLANKKRLSPALLEIVLDQANELGVED